MWKATVKGLLAHKLRLALTALSVVLGVGFVAGTFVLTDTLGHTFDHLFTEVNAHIDATVRSKPALGNNDGGFSDREPLPDSLLATVSAVPGVGQAGGYVQGYAQIVDKAGKAIAGQGPTFGGSAANLGTLSPFVVKSGHAPHGPTEAVVDAGTAKKHHLAVGDKVKILFSGPSQTFELVGVVGFGSADNLGGATFALFDLPTAQQVLNRRGQLDQIAVAGRTGVARRDLVQRINQALPPHFEAVSSAQAGQETANAIKHGLSFISIALLVFASVALFVGAFIIFNTFSIILAQRTRELGLLRALGASRRQVTRSVLGEAAMVGVVASAAGIGVGIVVAIGLKALLGAFGLGLPNSSLVVKARTIWVPMLLGTAVTAVASYVPARRASQVSPIAALGEDAGTPEASLRRRLVPGVVVLVLGAAALAGGLVGDAGALAVGVGALATFIGVAMLSPLVARPLALVIGAPAARLRGLPGKLGRQNAMRNPRRTASTAAALMIGLGLMSFVTIFAASVKASFTSALDRAVRADYILQTQHFGGFSTEVARQLADRPELAAASALRFGDWRLGAERKRLEAADPRTLASVVDVDMRTGQVADLARDGVLVYRKQALSHHWKVGDTIPMEFAKTGVRPIRIDGIYGDNRLFEEGYILQLGTYESNFTDNLDGVVLVKARPGVSPARSRAAVESVTQAFPNVKVEDQAQYKAHVASQIDKALGLMFVLLGLAVVIAIFGIVNTLALSVFERTRELGLLRAVGMARRQIRTTVRWESVIIATIGATLGLGIGASFGWALVSSMSGKGQIDTLVLPFGRLLGFFVFAALVGVVAAVFPARRAARLNVLDAIAHH